jgi:hypothetical protein
MIVAGLGLVALALAMGLVEAHVRRLDAWDRPWWALTRSYVATAGLCRAAALSAGIVILAVSSPRVALACVLGLVALWGCLRWSRSDRRGARFLAWEVERRKRERPGLRDAEALREILLERHARWGEDLIDRILADHPDPDEARRMVVRMERELER